MQAAFARKVPLPRLGRPTSPHSAFLSADDAAFITEQGVVIDGAPTGQP